MLYIYLQELWFIIHFCCNTFGCKLSISPPSFNCKSTRKNLTVKSESVTINVDKLTAFCGPPHWLWLTTPLATLHSLKGKGDLKPRFRRDEPCLGRIGRIIIRNFTSSWAQNSDSIHYQIPSIDCSTNHHHDNLCFLCCFCHFGDRKQPIWVFLWTFWLALSS